MKLRNQKVLDPRVVRIPWGRKRIPIPHRTILRLIDMKLNENEKIRAVVIWYYCTTEEVLRGIRSDTQRYAITEPVDMTGNKLDLILESLSIGLPIDNSNLLLSMMGRMKVVQHFARLEIKAAMERRNDEVSEEGIVMKVSRFKQIQPGKLLQRSTMLLRSKKRTGMDELRKKRRSLIKVTRAARKMMWDVCDHNRAMTRDATILWEMFNKQEVIARTQRDPSIINVRAKQGKTMLILQWMKQGKPFGCNQNIRSLIDLRRVNRRVKQFISNTQGMTRKRRMRQRRKWKLSRFI